MIPFQVLCEFLTTHKKYSWFYLDKDILPLLSASDLEMVYVEDIKEQLIVRVWYPKEKFTEKPLYQDEFKRLVAQAIEKEDWAEVAKLKTRLRKG